MKYRCEWCGSTFDEPDKEPDGLFMYNRMVREVCPECGSEYIEETEEEDEEF